MGQNMKYFETDYTPNLHFPSPQAKKSKAIKVPMHIMSCAKSTEIVKYIEYSN